MQNQAFRLSDISLSWGTSLREFKTSINLGGPAGSLGSRKAATLNQNISHDSERFSSLKCNNAILAIEVHHASRLFVFLVSQK